MTLQFFSAAFRPEDESRRQGAVDSLRTVSPADPVLHELLGETCIVLRTPIAMVTLTDGDVQRVVSAVGMEPVALPRAIAFCSHTIAAPEGMLSVPDLQADPRFRANPLVAGGPHVRHYTGVVVRSGPFPIGALCGLDRRPHGPASFRQRAELRRLADAVADHLGALPRRC
ncbi:GAF domain-containing protein [Sphingomonas sp. NFR04]|uniref:GAF domain-containing protein n=1 Tax=Sphingomonas sp. NFR04 TaxID=1566283 RepID=UPI0008E6C0F2|nr:GAF domain-containing protein [Sphingomonas sp. NFR04]SFJ62597.1 GAF domain-containing protein [Sphingomonas sp. NFR04]